MATGKQGFVRSVVPQHSVSAQRQGEVRIPAPLSAMYIQAVPSLPAAVRDAAVIPLPMPVMCANPAVPFVTVHVPRRAVVQHQRSDAAAASPRPKSAGKHMCPHCGWDCRKPSVLEKHLRCHTGERPYPCTTCGISFKTQSNLYKHKRTQAHARLSSESGKGTFSSQESSESSRETFSGPSLELASEDPADVNGSNGAVTTPTTPALICAQVNAADGKAGSETEQPLGRTAVIGISTSPEHGQQEALNPAGQQVQLSSKGINEASSMQTESPTRAPLTPNRTPLQRQEALFPKLSRGKTQSHGSTDSGFSEGSESNFTSSPWATLHDPSMESLAESSMELQEPGSSRAPSDVTHDDDKSKVSVQEKQKLEEHILKLISENSVLVDDRHLLNVRPRKTVLSKQGSIDLPMPYTYKDSFHFEMRSSKHQVSTSPKLDRRGRAIYSSVPTQYSASLEHAPLTRSSSLPFSVGIQKSERTASPHQGANVPLSRRCSAGNLCTFKSVDQHPPGHRLLVRQAAVDCLTGAEVSPMERGSHSNLSLDGDCPDAAAESSAKRSRRKKAQKFAYNKWYMYGGGTFKKLYDTETGSAQKSRTTALSTEQTENQGIQPSQQRDISSTMSSSSAAACLPPAVDVLPLQTGSQLISSYVLLQSQLINQAAQPLQAGLAQQSKGPSSDLSNETGCVQGTEEKNKGLDMQLASLIPSERKKQKTEDDLSVLIANTGTLTRQQCVLTSGGWQSDLSACDGVSQSVQSVCGDLFQRPGTKGLQKDNRLNFHRQGSLTSLPPLNQRQLLFKRHSSPLFVASESGTCSSASSVASSAPQVKPSFLPMYQLKIPCFTDGASDPQLRNPPSPKLFPSSRQAEQQGPHDTSSLSVPQSQPATADMSLGQEHQGTMTKTKCVACTRQGANALGKTQVLHQPGSYTSIISAAPTLVSSALQSRPANTSVQSQSTQIHSMSAGPTSPVLSQPLQTFTPLGQNQSVTVSTTHNTVSLLSHSSTSTKTNQICTVAMASVVQRSPAASVVISKKPLDTQVSVCQGSTDSTPLGMSQSEMQGSQFEDKMLLVNDSLQSLAQDTFYVRTADLQIVMQLISDEQLALIEPQIETQDFKLYGSHSFPHQDSSASQPVTVQTSVSQETHKQCSEHTVTKPHMSEGDMNRSTVSKIQDIIPTSAAATEQQNSSESATDAQGGRTENTYLTKTGLKGVISSSCSNTAAPQDSRVNALGQQCRSQKADVVAHELDSAGCGVTIRSYPKEHPGETLGEAPSADKPTASPWSRPQPSGSSAHGSRNLASTVREGEHGCRVTAGGPGAVHMPVASHRKHAAARQGTPMPLRENVPLGPDIPVSSGTCQLEDSQPVLTTAGQHKSRHLLAGMCKSVGETAEGVSEASCVSGGELIPTAALSLADLGQKELLSATQPSQPVPCQSACSTPAAERKNGCAGAPDAQACRRHPVHQTGARGGECVRSREVQENTCSPGQVSGQHLPQRDCCTQTPEAMWSNGEQGKGPATTAARVTNAHDNPHRPASKGTHKERIKCGETPGGAGHVSQDPRTGPWLGGSLQSSQLHWEAGTGFQEWAPQEPKTREEEKKKVQRSPEGNRIAAKPHPRLSPLVTNVCHNTHNYTAALSEETSLSQDVPALCQRECVSLVNSEQGRVSCGASVKVAQEQINQSMEKRSDQVPLGCHKRFTSLPTGHLHPACGHSSPENAVLKEDQKETHVRNAATHSHSRSSQLSEHKRDGTAEFRVSIEPCATLSPCNTAACGAMNTMPTDPNSPCPNLTNSYVIHSKRACETTTQSSPTESHASQCHLGGSYLEEEGMSSSSDDEGKLVIELE